MSADDARDSGVYCVVVNHEEQYSIWPADRARPAGWRQIGLQGSREWCLAQVAEIWTDMRPLSLRVRMDAEEAAARQGEGR